MIGWLFVTRKQLTRGLSVWLVSWTDSNKNQTRTELRPGGGICWVGVSPDNISSLSGRSPIFLSSLYTKQSQTLKKQKKNQRRKHFDIDQTNKQMYWLTLHVNHWNTDYWLLICFLIVCICLDLPGETGRSVCSSEKRLRQSVGDASSPRRQGTTYC